MTAILILFFGNHVVAGLRWMPSACIMFTYIHTKVCIYHVNILATKILQDVGEFSRNRQTPRSSTARWQRRQCHRSTSADDDQEDWRFLQNSPTSRKITVVRVFTWYIHTVVCMNVNILTADVIQRSLERAECFVLLCHQLPRWRHFRFRNQRRPELWSKQNKFSRPFARSLTCDRGIYFVSPLQGQLVISFLTSMWSKK